ncbi:cyclin-D-binding Myb-like transcription factor 1 [Orbicella faveolata]|uniref:cyclin-D-binding Myb-like transcription factor 1 n=1 Tax=Orbicella faveolata TaxID=48498 RepID=UPI0009E1C014|nr:cyclin-D-binding Myb-like transcription factor 1 [Orbicella faveolata]
MEVDGTNGHGELNEVSLQRESPCTVDPKALDENGGDLSFTSTFSPDGQVAALAELSGVKRKHTDQADDQVNKHLHLDPETSDGFADLATLVNMSSAASLAVSQVQKLALSCFQAADIVTFSQTDNQDSLDNCSTWDRNPEESYQTLISMHVHQKILGFFLLINALLCSQRVNVLVLLILLFLYFAFLQANNIPDPNIIIFEMTKDDRKDFYRTIAKGIRRPLFAIYRRVLRMYDRRNYVGKYSAEEVEQLKSLKEKHGNDWATIGAAMGRSASSVKDRFRLMRDHCHSGKWTAEEEQRLSGAVHELSSAASGDFITAGISWAAVAQRVGTRSEKQCRSKWLNYLNWKEKGGQEWTKQDEIQLITRSTGTVSYLYHTYIATLQNKIERQEARFKGNHIPRVSMVPGVRSTHVNPISTGTITNTGISHTITVSSDGTVTREDDTSSLATNHSRFEVVQVNALTPQDMFHNPSTVQGTPSYIIQAPAGQTYIIQQPAGSLVRQTHTGELTTGSEGIDSTQHDQVMIKALAKRTH